MAVVASSYCFHGVLPSAAYHNSSCGDMARSLPRRQLRKYRHVKLRVDVHEEERPIRADGRALNVVELVLLRANVGVLHLLLVHLRLRDTDRLGLRGRR